MHRDREELLHALPDIPRWVETRDLLGFDECPLVVDPMAPEPSFIIADAPPAPLASVVGHPAGELIRAATGSASEVLAFPENVEHVTTALAGWTAERVCVHAMPCVDALPETRHPTRPLKANEVGTLHHLEPQLADELQSAEREGTLIVVALDGALPVAFCYPSATTATLWDVAIDTIPSHRRRGYAQSAAIGLTRAQADVGLAPVWAAVESNGASLGLAQKLGFVQVDSIWLLAPNRRG